MDILFKHHTLGDLNLLLGPQDIFCWEGMVKSKSKQFLEDVPINIILTSNPDIDRVNLGFIETVVDDLGNYLERSIIFAKQKILENPGLYGLNDEETEEIKNTGPENFPLDLPGLDFYENDEWMIVFRVGKFNICEPLGLAILFNKEEPVRIEDLSHGEPIEY